MNRLRSNKFEQQEIEAETIEGTERLENFGFSDSVNNVIEIAVISERITVLDPAVHGLEAPKATSFAS